MSDADPAPRMGVEDLIHSYLAGGFSRQIFLRRMLALGIGTGFLETLLGPGVTRALAAPPPQLVPARSPRLVLVVMDGFRSDYLELASLPHLSGLMARGTTFERAWVGQLESYTPASHATISTGATPAHQGVIGFEWRDPVTGEEDYTAWYDDVIAGRLEQQLLQHGVNSIPQAIKGADPTARVVALSSDKYYAADAMGGHAADYILYGMPQGATIVTKGIPHHVPPDAFLADPALSAPWPLRQEGFDVLAMTMALKSLWAFDPRVLMINLPGADVYGHRVGGPANPAEMARIAQGCDLQLGRLIDALRAGNTLDETILVVTGDHGMVSNTYQVDDDVLKRHIRRSGGDYLFHMGGNCAFIWIRNRELARHVARHLVNTIAPAAFAHYQTIESGVYRYYPVQGPEGAIAAELESAQQYLLGTFAGPLAPDIVLAFQENTITRVHPNRHGEHGGATWGVQAVPLVMAGPGVRPGATSTFPARLMDIAPTVLTLFGLAPSRMDGIVLSDALLHPTAAQVTAQDTIAPALTAYQTAIRRQSELDIALQRSPH